MSPKQDLHDAAVESCDSPAPGATDRVAAGGASVGLLAARCREVGVATEMLLTKSEQVSDDRVCAAGSGLKRSRRRGYRP
jgi:hypothetical protein